MFVAHDSRDCPVRALLYFLSLTTVKLDPYIAIMADPLSIVAGVVGIVVPALHRTRVLIDDVKKIIDAPEAIRALQADLNSTELALESLKAVSESEWQSLGLTIAEQSKDAVRTCGSACDTFRSDLQRWTRRSRSGELSWRDRANVGFFKDRQIKAMSEHLQSCKLTCSSVAGMGTLYSNAGFVRLGLRCGG